LKEKLYFYKAKIASVYDGDTCRVDIDLGLHTWIRNERVRLSRIDAPEVRGDERDAGLRSRDYLRQLIDGKEVFIETIKDRKGKYGRYLAEIWLQVDGEWKNVNDMMVQAGQAVYVEY